MMMHRRRSSVLVCLAGAASRWGGGLVEAYHRPPAGGLWPPAAGAQRRRRAAPDVGTVPMRMTPTVPLLQASPFLCTPKTTLIRRRTLVIPAMSAMSDDMSFDVTPPPPPTSSEQAPLSREARARKLAVQGAILTALVIQSAGVSLLARRMCERVKYSGAAVSFVQELAKFPIAAGVVLGAALASKRRDPEGAQRPAERLAALARRVFGRPREVLQLCVPAGCFAAQNVLFFVAHERIPPTTYLVLSQTKSIFTAAFSVLLLPGKKLRALQWLSQPVLAAGAVCVLLPQIAAQAAAKGALDVGIVASSSGAVGMHDGAAAVARFLVGVNAALLSALLSGFANVYFERLIKQNDDAFWPRQLQLALATAVFTIPALPPGSSSSSNPNAGNSLPDLPALLAEFTPGVWAIVCLKSIGGLLIGATIRYTSAITKNFATACAIALTACVGGAAAFDNPAFCLGLSFVFASMALFNWPARSATPPPNAPTLAAPWSPPPSGSGPPPAESSPKNKNNDPPGSSGSGSPPS